jgi:hypothetical protein
VGENRSLQVAQLGAGVEPEVVDQPLRGVAVGGQRVGVATGAVEREHQLGHHPLAGGMLAHQRLKLTDHLAVAAEQQVCLNARLNRPQPKLLEHRDVRLRPRLVGHVGQRRSPPQRQRPAQQLSRAPGIALGHRRTAVLNTGAERVGV